MTIDFYSLMVRIGLAILTVVGCVTMLSAWFSYLQTKLRHSPNVDGHVHDLSLTSPGAWGEPDLAPPSQSPEALAEVAELESMWQRSSRCRHAEPG